MQGGISLTQLPDKEEVAHQWGCLRERISRRHLSQDVKTLPERNTKINLLDLMHKNCGMKNVVFSALCIIYVFSLQAQVSSEISVTIVSCKTGTLLIDGESIGQIEANDAVKKNLSVGEHYIQVKSATEKINLSIKVDQNTKEIIKIGCDPELTNTFIRVIDKEVNLSGTLGSDVEQNIIAFDTDDEIIVNCAVLNRKGNATIFLKDYNTGREIYRKEKFTEVKGDKIKIPMKGIYYFTLFTDALFGKFAKITIDRIPSKRSSPSFKTAVKVKTDTTSVEVLNTNTRVYSTTNLNHSNRTAIKINLPPKTTYWTYWIGVGQEAHQEMKDFVSNLSSAGSLFSTNPLVLFGMKLIPSLPMLNSTSTVSYQFTDSQNSQAFLNNLAYSYYTFKHAKNISTDYSLIRVVYPDIVLNMRNESTLDGQDVNVRVVAFVIKTKYVLEEE